MDFAEIVVDARHLNPVTVGINHSVPIHVVGGCSPQNRLLAAGVFGDIASDRAGVVGVGINRKHPALGGCFFGNLFIDGACSGKNRRMLSFKAVERTEFNIGNAV